MSEQMYDSEIDTYETIEALGRGGFGETLLAQAKSSGEQVVLKQLRVDRLEDWKALELFEREAAVLEQLEHAHIPRYIDHFALEGDRGMCLVQEYVAGPTLQQLMRQQDRLDEDRMVRWFLELLEVFAYLHGLDPPVIHRDVTPGNVLLRQADGAAFLIDFGTVQAAVRSESTISSTSAGTFGYAPPEQFIGKAYPSGDLYGLAMTFLAVWSGQPPHQMPFERGRVQLDALLEGRPMDARLKLALERMSAPVREDRPERAGPLLERLAPLARRLGMERANAPGPALEVSRPAPPRARGRRRRRRGGGRGPALDGRDLRDPDAGRAHARGAGRALAPGPRAPRPDPRGYDLGAAARTGRLRRAAPDHGVPDQRRRAPPVRLQRGTPRWGRRRTGSGAARGSMDRGRVRRGGRPRVDPGRLQARECGRGVSRAHTHPRPLGGRRRVSHTPHARGPRAGATLRERPPGGGEPGRSGGRPGRPAGATRREHGRAPPRHRGPAARPPALHSFRPTAPTSSPSPVPAKRPSSRPPAASSRCLVAESPSLQMASSSRSSTPSSPTSSASAAHQPRPSGLGARDHRSVLARQGHPSPAL